MPARARNNRPLIAATTMCVTYARVSSAEQAAEGFSIPAQQRLLREYAVQHGFRIAQEFVDVETARRAGREAFGTMIDYLRQHPTTCWTILVEKTDRLTRNLKDHVLLEDLGVTMHFVKENAIISPDSKSAEKFVFGIKVLCARQMTQNLSEETKKGQVQKALSGIYPSFAPAGYQNVIGPEGKRIITRDDPDATTITDLYTLFATGQYSIKDLAKLARTRGMTLRGKRLHKSTLHHVLRKRIYSGDFDYDGTTYKGTHEPLVTKDTWDAVQAILDKRHAQHASAIRQSFPFSGFLTCGHCGCALVAERKKQQYVYYHCTKNRGECGAGPYTRQETIIDAFATTLGDLVIPTPILEWLASAITASDMTERGARDATSKRLTHERERLHRQQTLLYEDRLAGRINAAMYDANAATLQAQLDAINKQLTSPHDTARMPLVAALDIARLTSNACKHFREQDGAEQRKLLTMILKTATWTDGALRTTLLEPFEQLRHSNWQSHTKHSTNGIGGMNLEIWLPG